MFGRRTPEGAMEPPPIPPDAGLEEAIARQVQLLEEQRQVLAIQAEITRDLVDPSASDVGINKAITARVVELETMQRTLIGRMTGEDNQYNTITKDIFKRAEDQLAEITDALHQLGTANWKEAEIQLLKLQGEIEKEEGKIVDIIEQMKVSATEKLYPTPKKDDLESGMSSAA